VTGCVATVPVRTSCPSCRRDRGRGPPFNASIGPHRRFAYTTIPLEDARDIRRPFGVTFNDVVMALCAGTLRSYLVGLDALPAEPMVAMVAMVPISVRRDDEEDVFRKRVSG
jgi:diacylglycerol O-acyltransferase / wax synthase